MDEHFECHKGNRGWWIDRQFALCKWRPTTTAMKCRSLGAAAVL
jgi:hypothetical protein